MISRIWLSVLAAATAVCGSAHAQPAGTTRAGGPAVIELFTSQGCSSCPAADALFKTYAARRDVIALSMPVDYWDYLGWKDTLASPKFTKRQRAYAKLRGDGQVYTPQAVVNGIRHVNGAARQDIEAALAANRPETGAAAIKASLVDGTITIEVASAAPSAADSTIWLVVLQAEAQVEIRAGENRGRKLTYYNVVREMLPLGMWSGAATTIKQQTAALSGTAGDRYAVLVQKGMGGPILSAAWIEPAR